MKKLIKNGTIVLEDKVIQGDLLIEDEVIAAIGQDLEADGEQVIDASGMVVLPGGIDVHTHFNIELLQHLAVRQQLWIIWDLVRKDVICITS